MSKNKAIEYIPHKPGSIQVESSQTWNYHGITLLYNFTTALLYMVSSVTMARIVPLTSSKRPPYWNFTSGFHFHTSLQSTCHSVPVCKILSKSDHPLQKKIMSCRFSRWRISAILDCRDPIMGSLKSPCTTSYRSSIHTIALNCLVFEKIPFFAFWR